MKRLLIVGVFVCVVLAGGCVPARQNFVTDISAFDFRDGDVLMQHIPSYLCSVIADVTDSQYSHCGIVVYRNGQVYVLEAVGPVCYTPIRKWLNRGALARFAQFRPRNLDRAMIRNAIAEARKMLGKPYDIQYELDEKKIYCSELVYKAFLRGCRKEIGKKESLGSLNWKPHEKFIRHITGGSLPLKRMMVTPESVAQSQELSLVYSTFPARSREPVYSSADLAGTWRGEYTIKGLEKAVAVLKLGPNGRLVRGYIKTASGRLVGIRSFKTDPFSSARSFSATLTDGRGITARINARIRDKGNRIIGTWKDRAGNSGIFSFANQQEH